MMKIRIYLILGGFVDLKGFRRPKLPQSDIFFHNDHQSSCVNFENVTGSFIPPPINKRYRIQDNIEANQLPRIVNGSAYIKRVLNTLTRGGYHRRHWSIEELNGKLLRTSVLKPLGTCTLYRQFYTFIKNCKYIIQNIENNNEIYNVWFI